MAMCHFLSAQSIGIGTSTPNPKAILDVESTNQGILLPRLTDTSAVSAPVPAGLTIYSISDKKIYFYDGTKWQRSSTQTASDGLWYERHDSILYTDRKFVGVNTNLGILPPQANLQVTGSLLVQGDYTYTQAAPTPAQTYTMNNAPSQNIAATDSIFRILDTGGTSDYLVNTQGNILCFPTTNQKAFKISFNPIDFGIAEGDTLWISEFPYPVCRTNYIQMWVNTFNPPNDLYFQTSVGVRIVFRSNYSVVGSGFDINLTRIYSKDVNQAVQIIGPGMCYDASKNSFRVGKPSNGIIGFSSIALGELTTASGEKSTAMGFGTISSGFNSTALGQSTIGSGGLSTALGAGTNAIGFVSTAMGAQTTASGSYSTAMGTSTAASGSSSTAMGNGTKASGDNSTAIGEATMAKANNSLAIGRYNDTIAGADPNQWIPTDPILMIGNGTASNARSNALTVLKNGNVGIGPSSPTSKLEVLGTNNDSPLVKLTQLGTAAPALKIAASSGNNGGLELENATLKISGSNKFVFEHICTAGNQAGGNGTLLPNTGFANSPTDLLIVTPVYVAAGVFINFTPHAYWDSGAYGGNGGWMILNPGGPVPVNTRYNVMVIKQ